MKKQKSQSKKYDFIAWLPIFAVSILFFNENPQRTVVVSILLLIWLGLQFLLRKKILASLLFLLIVLPLNITIGFPSLVDPYVAGVYVNYLVPTIAIVDIAVVLLFTSLFSEGRRAKKIPSSIYILGVYLAFHLLLHRELLVAVNSARILLYVLTGWMMARRLKTLSAKPVLYVLIGSVLIQGMIGIFQFSSGSSIGLGFLGESNLLSGTVGSSFVSLSSGQFLRAYGTFPHPNLLAGYLLFTSFIGLWGYFFWKNRKPSIVLVLLSSFFILFTLSRITIALLVFSIAVIFVQLASKGKVFSFIPLLSERFLSILGGYDFSLSDRAQLLKSAAEIFKENPLSGIGFGNFVRGMEGRVIFTEGGISLMQPVHNILSLVLVEHGVFGGILLVVIYLRSLLSKLFTAVGWERLLRLLIVGSILVIGVFDHYLLTLPQGLVILVAAALL